MNRTALLAAGLIAGVGVITSGVVWVSLSGRESEVAQVHEPSASAQTTATARPTSEPTSTPVPTLRVPPRRIFFTRASELWSINLDGGDPLLLSADVIAYSGAWLSGQTTPNPSPLGNRAAFVASDRNLWVVDSDGANPKRLSEEGQPEDDVYYSSQVRISGWSPDGNEIVYYVDAIAYSEDPANQKAQRTNGGFYAVDTASGRKVRLADLTNFVAWTTDPASVIYEQQYDLGSSRDWFTFDITSGVSSKLTLELFECANVQPSFTAASGKLLYACGSSGTTESRIVFANLNNTDRNVLLQGKWAEYQFPAFSPTGDAFVYQHQSDVMAGGKVIFDLRVFDLETGQTTQLASGCVRHKGWIDDQTVLFLHDKNELCSGEATLYRVDVETGGLTKLAEEVDWN